MADETIQNRAELEYTARVNRQSFRQAREDVRRETQQAVDSTKRATSTAGVSDTDIEAIRRERAERDRLRAERQSARSREGQENKALSDAELREVVRIHNEKERQRAQELKEIRQIHNEKLRMAREEARNARTAAREEQAWLQSQYPSQFAGRRIPGGGAGGFGGGGRGFSGGSFGGRQIDPFLLSLGFGGMFAGVPGAQQIGSIAVGAGFGGPVGAAGAAIPIALVAGLEAVKEAAKDQTALITFTARITTLGASFTTARADAESFRASLGGTREEAGLLAIEFARLQQAGIARPQDIEDIKKIALARGQTAEQVAKVLEGIRKGSKDTFENETGIRAEEAYARAAIALDTEIKYLTDAQKERALYNEYKSQSNQLEEIAKTRLNDTSYQYEQLKKNALDYFSAAGAGIIDLSEKIKKYLQGGGPQIGPVTLGQGVRNLFDVGKYGSPITLATEYLVNTGYARQQEEISRLQNASILSKNQQQQLQPGTAGSVVSVKEQVEEIIAANKRLSDENERFIGSSSEKARLLLEDYEKFKTSLIGVSDEVRKLTKEIDDSYQQKIKALAEEARSKVVAFSKTFRDSFSELATLELGDRNNPYVRLFSEAELAAAKAKERFGLAGDEVVAKILQAQKALRDTEVYELRLKDNLSAVKLEFESAQLAKPFVELTREMKNTLSVFQLELQQAIKGPQLLFQARQIETGGYAGLPLLGGPLQGFSGLQLQEIRRLRQRYAGEEGLGGEEIKHLLNQQLITLYSQLSPEERRQVFQFGEARLEFADAYRGEEAYGRRQIELQIQRNLANLSNVRLAESQLKELGRLSQGQDRDITRRAFLDITGTLSREELTPDIIKGRIAALQEEARFVREREDRAKKAIEETRKFQEQVQQRLQDIKDSIESRNEKVIIEVIDRTDSSKISTLGESY